MNCVNQCHGDVLSALAHKLHEPHDAENLHREAAEKGTGEVREWIGQIIMITQVYGNRLTYPDTAEGHHHYLSDSTLPAVVLILIDKTTTDLFVVCFRC